MSKNANGPEREIRMVALTVGLKDTEIFSETQIRIEIEDEGSGEFVVVSQGDGESRLRINKDEWPSVRAAVNQMMETCR